MATTRITPAPLTRTLSEIASEVAVNWPRVQEAGTPTDFGGMTLNVGEHPAHPYWVAMLRANTTDLAGFYYQDPLSHIVRYFVENASAWRGETAQRVKAELRAALADYDAQRNEFMRSIGAPRHRAHRS